MALEMKKGCERCGGQLSSEAEVYICVHECTFCKACSASLNFVCPNCGGELVRRPPGGRVSHAADRDI